MDHFPRPPQVLLAPQDPHGRSSLSLLLQLCQLLLPQQNQPQQQHQAQPQQQHQAQPLLQDRAQQLLQDQASPQQQHQAQALQQDQASPQQHQLKQHQPSPRPQAQLGQAIPPQAFELSSIPLAHWTNDCQYHGLVPLAYPALVQALGSDHPLCSALRPRYLAHTVLVGRACAELARLQRGLEGAGVRSLAIKGPALAYQAYGRVGDRQVSDLDLLVAPQQALEAGRQLRALGYRPAGPPPLSEVQEQALIRYSEARQFLHPDGHLVDLTWHTLDRWMDLSLPFEGLWQRRQVLPWPEGPVATLGLEDSALLVALHGAQHGFERLKWVLDLAMLTARPLDWNQIAHRAGHRGPMLAYALTLSHRLLGSRLPSAGLRPRAAALTLSHRLLGRPWPPAVPLPSAAVLALVQQAEDRIRHPQAPRPPKRFLDPTIATTLHPALSRWGWLALPRNLLLLTRPTKDEVTQQALPRGLWPVYRAMRLARLADNVWRRL